MRHRLAILVPLFALLALAGCGRAVEENYRNEYRERSVQLCVGNAPAELASMGLPAVDRPGLEIICGCTVDRYMQNYSTNQLRSQSSRTDLTPEERAAQSLAFGECAVDLQRANANMAPPPPPPVPGAEGSDAGDGGGSGPAVRARASPALNTLLSTDDYPAAAIRNEEQGLVAFTLNVGPDGRVTSCAIRQSSGSTSLDQATCRIMRSRARYTPARDTDGRAVADQDRGTIRWVLPPE